MRKSMKTLSLCIGIVYMLSSMIHSEGIPRSQPGFTSPLDDALVRFTGNIFSKTRRSTQNLVLSPISIHQALNLVLLGAKKHSQTRSEIEKALGYLPEISQHEYFTAYKVLTENFKTISSRVDPDFNKKQTVIDVWSSIISKNGAEFQPSYIRATSDYFNSSVGRVLDSVPSTKQKLLTQVNKWAKEAGFESDVLTEDELDGISDALLMSAIRVEASWTESFSEFTDDYTFYNHNRRDSSSKKPRAILGAHYGSNFGYIKFAPQNQHNYGDEYRSVINKNSKLVRELASLNFQVINIALKDNLSFTIFEPLGIATNGNELDKLVNHLTSVDQADNQTRLIKVIELVDNPYLALPMKSMRFPKFKFDSSIDLVEPLKSMGMAKMFSPASELTELAYLPARVDKASHRAFIETNEHGIKGAAITKFGMMLMSAPVYNDIISVAVTHPFMFMVRFGELPLFIGQVVEV